jgi:excinuclease ABC subunit A
VDTIGRILVPRTHTSSVAYEPLAPGAYDTVENRPASCVVVDQAKAGVIDPSAYVKLDREIRKLFAATSGAAEAGLDERSFRPSCSACRGKGFIDMDMGFLPNLRTPCDACGETGYSLDVRSVRYRGRTIAEIMLMSVDDVRSIMSDIPAAGGKLDLLHELGLGYLILRQPAFTLSGGEVQRLKIARELSKKTRDGTMYILDEPTVGQHMDDVERLCGILARIRSLGNTVLVVEHHPWVLAASDWIVELGPGGGEAGGEIVFSGPPSELARARTPTASWVREALARRKEQDR